MIKEKVNENARKAAKTMYRIYHAKSDDCIARKSPWQNERQRSVNNIMLW